MWATGDDLYISSWSRIPPYISGTFLAWLTCSRELRAKNLPPVSEIPAGHKNRLQVIKKELSLILKL